MLESANFRVVLDEDGYLGITLKSAFSESMWVEEKHLDELIEILTKMKEQGGV